MSHIVSITTQVKDPAAIHAAARRMGLPEPVHGTAELYSGRATGYLVALPGWQYPAVFDTANGTAQFDNFSGCWGEQVHLDKFLQMYAVEKAKLEARKQGRIVAEEQLQDGSIKLTIREAF